MNVPHKNTQKHKQPVLFNTTNPTGNKLWHIPLCKAPGLQVASRRQRAGDQLHYGNCIAELHAVVMYARCIAVDTKLWAFTYKPGSQT
jgi:hypothetical protein